MFTRSSCTAVPLLLISASLTTGAAGQVFQPAPTLSPGSTTIAVADIDRSGLPDAIVHDGTGIHLITDPGLTGAGVRVQVTPPINFDDRLGGPRIVDLDGDGELDLLIPVSGSTFDLYWIAGLGGGTFAAPVLLGSFVIWFHNEYDVGDFNADGLLDIAVLDGTNAFMPTAEILTQNAGTFARTTLQVANSLRTGDFDGDGHDDLVTGQGGGAIYRGGPGGLQLVRHFAHAVGLSFNRTADFDGDGCDDLLWFGFGGIAIQWGDATTVLAPVLQPLPYLTTGIYTTVGDFDADGVLDIAHQTAPASMLRGRGNRAFSPLHPVPSLVANSHVADLDGDGDSDIIGRSGQRLHNLARYGNPCGAAMHLSASPVSQGSPWQLDLHGAPANTLAAILFGTQDQATTCGTLVDPTSLLGSLPLLFTNATGAASQSIAIPPGFVGGPFYLQAIALDPAGGYQRYGLSLSSSGARAVHVF